MFSAAAACCKKESINNLLSEYKRESVNSLDDKDKYSQLSNGI